MRFRYRTKKFDPKIIEGDCVIFNTESTFWYDNDSKYHSYVDDCSNIFIDGIGVAIKLFGLRGFTKRYNGPDLLTDIIQYSIERKKKVVLIGGRELTSQTLSELNIFAQICLPISNEIEHLFEIVSERSEVLTESIILVSLGLPKQERFARRLSLHKEEFNYKSIIPIGAAVDFLSGEKHRSSSIWQILGLEWLPRLIREPRMLKRIYYSLIGLIHFETHNFKR